MIGVKICGITNFHDARSAIECGADALGFIFYSKSPRYVSPAKAKGMIRRLPGEVTRVGVFVNQGIEEVKETARFCDLSLIQLHGDESIEYCSQFETSVLIKAVMPRTGKGVARLKDYPVAIMLIDAYAPGRYGGTGRVSDWSLAARIKKTHPLILAGGLRVENIREAIEAVRPHAVDINSGVEISPGKKDPVQMREIIEIVRKTGTVEKEGIFRREAGPL